MKYRIVFLPFPETVRGCVRLLDDGSYIIGIKEDLPEDEKKKVLRHEFEHIRRGHFTDPRPIEIIEQEAAAG